MVVAGRRPHRGLSTARAALQVTWLLARDPDGVRADEVAQALGKSVSTAYNLLASLCDDELAPAALAARVVLRDVAAALVAAGQWPGATLHDS